MTPDPERLEARLRKQADGWRVLYGTAEDASDFMGIALLREAAEEIATLRAERDDYEAVARQIRKDLDSERDRRVAAQEGITLHWQPRAEKAEAERDALAQQLREGRS